MKKNEIAYTYENIHAPTEKPKENKGKYIYLKN